MTFVNYECRIPNYELLDILSRAEKFFDPTVSISALEYLF
jgi:hypothetical protein